MKYKVTMKYHNTTDLEQCKSEMLEIAANHGYKFSCTHHFDHSGRLTETVEFCMTAPRGRTWVASKSYRYLKWRFNIDEVVPATVDMIEELMLGTTGS